MTNVIRCKDGFRHAFESGSESCYHCGQDRDAIMVARAYRNRELKAASRKRKRRQNVLRYGFSRKMRSPLGACCTVCAGEEALARHHLVPFAEGGSNDASNLVTLCKPCHDLAHEVFGRGNRYAGPRTQERFEETLSWVRARCEYVDNSGENT